MQVRDADLVKSAEKLAAHYTTNINNRILRPVLLKMEIDNTSWGRIERLTTSSDVQHAQGYDFQELYEQIIAMAKFIELARNRVAPTIRNLLSGHDPHGRAENPTERVLRDMAVKNFDANLAVLTDLLNDLYVRAVELDKRLNAAATPIYTRLPELKQLGARLV